MIDKIFHRQSTSEMQLIVSNFHIEPDYETLRAEWSHLQDAYKEMFRPSDVLSALTSIRYQTQLENGVAKDGSLHNMRVLDAGVKFYGRLQLKKSGEEELQLLALSMRNLKSAGLKRNRGFGRIKCTMAGGDELIEKFFKARGALT